MRATLKAVVSVMATCGLTVWILTWIAWIPGISALMGYMIDTAAWRWLRAADASLRLALGATIGPESDEMLLVWCSLAISFFLATALVWVVNRLVNNALARARHRQAGRIAA